MFYWDEMTEMSAFVRCQDPDFSGRAFKVKNNFNILYYGNMWAFLQVLSSVTEISGVSV